MPRYYDERMIQPVIHSTLLCAAGSARENTECDHDFNATTDSQLPLFMSFQITASESVVDGKAYRILVEIKGTGTFPYNLACTDGLDPLFCQVMQLAALALINQKWHAELLYAAVTADKWYLFNIEDISEHTQSEVKLHIRRCLVHARRGRSRICKSKERFFIMANLKNTVPLCLLIHFLTSYLCTHPFRM